MDASIDCPDCSMSFRSEGLLEKHRRLFCVRADEEDKIDEENEYEKEQDILKAKIMELERLKRRKSELRRDREEREKQLLMKERENGRPSSESESLWQRKSAKLLNLQKTEDRRKQVEKPREDSSWNRASTASSASIELPPTSVLPTPMINSSEQIIALIKMETELYNKKLAQRRQQMEELIVQKQAIDNRLREFEEEKTRPMATRTVLVEQLMTQQEENQTNLMRLQRNQSTKSGNDPHSLIERKQPDFLLKQINVVRQRYLDSGGCNPEILLDIAAMERDALDLLEKHLEVDQVELQNKEKHRILNEELEAFEIDNQRLEKELINLHEANTDKLELQVSDCDEYVADELNSARRKQNNAKEMARIETEIQRANHEIRLNRIKKRLENLK